MPPKVFTTVHGEGEPPLVFLHGWACTHHIMAPLVDVYADRHRCISLDLPGHGQSPHTDDYSIKAQAAAVLDAIPAGAIVIGHSMGAQIALEATAHAPKDHIRGIVLLDPAPFVSFPKAQAAVAALYAQLVAAADLSAVLDACARAGFVDAQNKHIDTVAAVMRATPPSTALGACQAFGDYDGHAALAALSCPGLMIVIEKAMNRPADVVKINPLMRTAQTIGLGHMLHWEGLAQIIPMIDRFFWLNQWSRPLATHHMH